jgi:hypothetical protein
MAFCRWFRWAVGLPLFLPMLAIASNMRTCPKAATSSKGHFLVIIERKLERINKDESRITKTSYEIYPREDFSDDRKAFHSSSDFWYDSLEWNAVNPPNSDSLFLCPEPLLSDDGQFLILLNDASPGQQSSVVWIYRRPSDSHRDGVLVKTIKLVELWPADKFQQQPMLFTGADPLWFAGGSFEFSSDNRILIYKTPWNTEIRISLADGTVQHN